MAFKFIPSLVGKLEKYEKYLPPPLREVLSEPDGSGSYSRTSGFLIIVAVILWGSYLVIHNHAMPDLAGAAALVGSAQAAYGVNKVMNKKNDGGPDATTP